MCHHDYLGPEVLCLLESDQRAELPSGPDWFAHNGPGEEGDEESTHRILLGIVGRAGSHHRLRVLPESGVIQSHCGQSCYGDYFVHPPTLHHVTQGKGRS